MMFHKINVLICDKNSFLLLDLGSESFHNDDSYDTLNDPKRENVTEATLRSLTGNKAKI